MATELDQPIQILLKSFGFKYGLPANVDFVFDVRCLPNPYWEPELKALSGLDKPVLDYLAAMPGVQSFLSQIITFIEAIIPYFQADQRTQLTLAIGCTGGQHRSVYIVERIAQQLRTQKIDTAVEHSNLTSRSQTK